MIDYAEYAFWCSVACWLAGVVLTIPRIRRKTVPLHGLWLVMSLVGILTSLRTGLFIYLKVVVPYYEYNRFERVLSLSLYPEVMIFDRLIMHVMPMSAFPGSLLIYPTFWLILVSMLFIGSFMWLYPVWALIAKEKEGEANLP